MVYGMGVPTLWNALLTQGHRIGYAEAQHLHTTWKSTFPRIAVYQQNMYQQFHKSHHPLPHLKGTKCITSVLGRVRRPKIQGERSPFKTQHK